MIMNFEEAIFDWNEDKNNLLKNERNISFEDIVFALKSGKLIQIIPSPSPTHPNQECFLINIKDYIYIIPYVYDDKKIFLKTIYASRKHTKYFLNK